MKNQPQGCLGELGLRFGVETRIGLRAEVTAWDIKIPLFSKQTFRGATATSFCQNLDRDTAAMKSHSAVL